MPSAALQAVLASFLPLIPLLFPQSANPGPDTWAQPVPHPKVPSHPVSASIHSAGANYSDYAHDFNTTLTPERLADLLSGYPETSLPVLESLKEIWTHVAKSPSLKWTAGMFVFTLLAFTLLSSRTLPRPTRVSAPSSAPNREPLSRSLPAHKPSPACHTSHETPIPSAPSSFVPEDASHRVYSEAAQFHELAIHRGTPSPMQSPTEPGSGEVRLVYQPLLPDVPTTAHPTTVGPNPADLQCSVNCPSEEELLSSLSDDSSDCPPPRTSWSIERACEVASLELSALASTPLNSPGWHTPSTSSEVSDLAESPEPPGFHEPEVYPQRLIDIAERLRILSDITEATEPESEQEGPRTPRARWFSGIHRRIANLDNTGLTLGDQTIATLASASSSPEMLSDIEFSFVDSSHNVARAGLRASDSESSHGPGRLDVPTDVDVSDDSEIVDYQSDSAMSTQSRSLVFPPSEVAALSGMAAQARGIASTPVPMPDILSAHRKDGDGEEPAISSLVDAPSASDAQIEAHTEGESGSRVLLLPDTSSFGAPTRSCSSGPIATPPLASFPPLMTPRSIAIEQLGQPIPEVAPSVEASSIPPPPTAPRSRSVTVVRAGPASGPRSRKPTKVIVGRAGLPGQQIALTPEGIDRVADTLQFCLASGCVDGRILDGIISMAVARHSEPIPEPRESYEVLRDLNEALAHVPARVQKSIINSARTPSLQDDQHMPRTVFEVCRSRGGQNMHMTTIFALERSSCSQAATTSTTNGGMEASPAGSLPVVAKDAKLGKQALPHTTPMTYASVAAAAPVPRPRALSELPLRPPQPRSEPYFAFVQNRRAVSASHATSLPQRRVGLYDSRPSAAGSASAPTTSPGTCGAVTTMTGNKGLNRASASIAHDEGSRTSDSTLASVQSQCSIDSSNERSTSGRPSHRRSASSVLNMRMKYSLRDIAQGAHENAVKTGMASSDPNSNDDQADASGCGSIGVGSLGLGARSGSGSLSGSAPGSLLRSSTSASAPCSGVLDTLRLPSKATMSLEETRLASTRTGLVQALCRSSSTSVPGGVGGAASSIWAPEGQTSKSASAYTITPSQCREFASRASRLWDARRLKTTSRNTVDIDHGSSGNATAAATVTVRLNSLKLCSSSASTGSRHRHSTAPSVLMSPPTRHGHGQEFNSVAACTTGQVVLAPAAEDVCTVAPSDDLQDVGSVAPHVGLRHSLKGLSGERGQGESASAKAKFPTVLGHNRAVSSLADRRLRSSTHAPDTNNTTMTASRDIWRLRRPAPILSGGRFDGLESDMVVR